VGAEIKLLKKNTRQQQKPTPLLQRGLKKRASSNPDQDGSCKRHKAAQLEDGGSHSDGSDNDGRDDEEVEDMDGDTNMMEDLLPPAVTDTDRQSMFIERSRGVMEMRWTTSRQDGGSHSDGSDNDGSDNDGRDDEEVEDMDGDRDVDEEEEDKDGDEEDEDYQPPFYDSEIPGISNWDLLGEHFEREAAALGLYSSRMNYLPS